MIEKKKVICTCGENAFKLDYEKDKWGDIDFVVATCIKCGKKVEIWAYWDYGSASIEVKEE